MDRTERFYRIRRRLVEKGALTRREIEEELEISHSTFKRDIDYMRDRLNVPIIWSVDRQAYVLDPDADVAELPGVWFSPGEIYALLEIEHLLEQLEPGLLSRQLGPVRERLAGLLEGSEKGHREIRRRIKVLPMGTRPVNREVFETLSFALLDRRQLRIRHLRRQTGKESERTVSPQRLVHYRYNWYLDAWCHTRSDIRIFAVDAIRTAQALEDPAREVDDGRLDEVLRAGYGIFAGESVERAVLKFSPGRARWVANEVWHSRQVGRMEADGSYVLELPYSQEPELVMDVLKYGGEVEVLSPASLRRRVAQELAAGAALYEAGDGEADRERSVLGQRDEFRLPGHGREPAFAPVALRLFDTLRRAGHEVPPDVARPVCSGASQQQGACTGRAVQPDVRAGLEQRHRSCRDLVAADQQPSLGDVAGAFLVLAGYRQRSARRQGDVDIESRRQHLDGRCSAPGGAGDDADRGACHGEFGQRRGRVMPE